MSCGCVWCVSQRAYSGGKVCMYGGAPTSDGLSLGGKYP